MASEGGAEGDTPSVQCAAGAGTVLEILLHMTHIKRFDMATAFLTSGQKESVNALFAWIEQRLPDGDAELADIAKARSGWQAV